VNQTIKGSLTMKNICQEEKESEGQVFHENGFGMVKNNHKIMKLK
jgi:hypothetical protein